MTPASSSCFSTGFHGAYSKPVFSIRAVNEALARGCLARGPMAWGSGNSLFPSLGFHALGVFSSSWLLSRCRGGERGFRG